MKSRTRASERSKFRLIHEIDGIYEGEVNDSYQRQGFGILQTDEYHTYIGQWRGNKPNGLGLIILPNCDIVYGHFVNNVLEGVFLLETEGFMRCGIVTQMNLVGIGFQFHKGPNLWKMNNYHKGVSIETLKEETQLQKDSIPGIITVEPDILEHYLNYIRRKCFPTMGHILAEDQEENFNQKYFHLLPDGRQYIGRLEGGKKTGLGVIFKSHAHQIIECGLYQLDKLCGYSLKKEGDNCLEMGLYVQGKKHGHFYEKIHGKETISCYVNGVLTEDNDQEHTQARFKKERRLHNYRQMDFMSRCHGLTIKEIIVLFDSQEIKAWKKKLSAEVKLKKKHKKVDKHKNIGKRKEQVKPLMNVTMQPREEKSAVQIIRFKIAKLKSEPLKKNSSSNKEERLRKLQKSIAKSQNTDSPNQKENLDDSIPEQQNPFIDSARYALKTYKRAQMYMKSQ